MRPVSLAFSIKKEGRPPTPTPPDSYSEDSTSFYSPLKNRPNDLDDSEYRIVPPTSELKGILKKKILCVFPAGKSKQKKREVRFCLEPLTQTSIIDDLTEGEKAEKQHPELRRKSVTQISKKKKKKKKRIKEGYPSKLLTEKEIMATKTAPGPLSLGLYLFVVVVTLFLGLIFAHNEWKIVQARVNVLPLQNNVVPISCEASEEWDGRLVHIDCPLRRLYTFYPPIDFAWNVGPFEGIFYEMRVEMYQWVLKPSLFGFRFGGRWTSNLIDSSTYPTLFYNKHINPDFFPHINGAGRRFASQLHGGDFRLHKRHLLDFHEKKQLPLTDDGYYTPPSERPPTSVSYLSTQVIDNALYTGDPNKPKIGDLRITFWGSSATHVSAIAQQNRLYDSHYELHAYSDGSNMMQNSTVREIVLEGDYNPAQMLDHYLRQNGPSHFIVWALRISTVILTTVTVIFTYRIFDRSVKIALMPVVFGSLLIAIGIMQFLIAPLWLMCQIWRAVLYWTISPILIILGSVLWNIAKRQINGDPETEMATNHLLSESTTHDPVKKHFYQPV